MNTNAKKIYPDSDEKLVMSVTVYEGNEGLFYDEAHTKPVSSDEALDLFNKGLMTVAVDGGFLKPSSITVDGTGKISLFDLSSVKGNIFYAASSIGDETLSLFKDLACTTKVGADDLSVDKAFISAVVFKSEGPSIFHSINEINTESHYVKAGDSRIFFNN